MTIRLHVVTANRNFFVALQRFIPTLETKVGHGIELLGASYGMVSAQQDIAASRPDLVLSDLGSPDGAIDGLAIARWLRQLQSPPALILCSLYEDAILQSASEEAGSFGFINKSHLDSQLPLLLARLFPPQ